jgi:hypothetical protein
MLLRRIATMKITMPWFENNSRIRMTEERTVPGRQKGIGVRGCAATEEDGPLLIASAPLFFTAAEEQ